MSKLWLLRYTWVNVLSLAMGYLGLTLLCTYLSILLQDYPIIHDIHSFIATFKLVSLLIMPLMLVVTLVRYRSEVDVFVNRRVVYELLSLFIGVIFLGLIFFAQVITKAIFSDNVGQIIILIISSLIAVRAYNPTRQTLKRVIDRRLFRLRLDKQQLAHVQQLREAELGRGTLSGTKLNEILLESLVGKGGMGRVYRAKLGRKTVAVKILPSEIADDVDYRERFKREAEIVAQINHPNIVHLLKAGEMDGVPYMVMEFVEGEELGSCLKREKTLPIEQVRLILADIANALDYLHGQGIVHRDIKPNNIILQDMRAVLTDFGLAKFLNRSTDSGGVLGTLEYVSPEQIQGNFPITHHADIYSLGVLAYRMLVGEAPFKGNIASVVFSHINQPPPDPRHYVPTIPYQSAMAIMKALAKHPDSRFDSAGEFVLQL